MKDDNEVGAPINVLPLLAAHKNLTQALVQMQETRDSLNYKDPCGRALSVTITQTETSLLWMQEFARQAGIHIPHDNS